MNDVTNGLGTNHLFRLKLFRKLKEAAGLAGLEKPKQIPSSRTVETENLRDWNIACIVDSKVKVTQTLAQSHHLSH